MSADTQRLGKYRVLEHVARGPLADVLRARLDGLAGFSRLFAVKHLHPELAAHPEAVARIEAQARRAAALSHGNIVQVLDLGRDDAHRPFLVLEWVEGWSLAEVLEQARAAGTPLPAAQVAWIGLQVLHALEYAHTRPEGEGGPLVHGALCPANVLLGRGGDVKVADFGLGRAASELSRELPELVPPRLDRATPEELSGVPLVPASDLFGVAAVLYTCLTLRPPFAGDIAAAIVDGAFTPLAEAAPDAPPTLARAVDAALAPAASARPASATALKQALAPVLHGQVFTQEHLAAWVKDLFGIEDTAGTGSLPRPAAVDLPAVDDDTGESPVLSFAEAPLEADRTTPAAPDALAHPVDDDAHTVVRVGGLAGAVGGGAPPAETPPDEPAEGWDDAATVVHPKAAATVAALRREVEAAPPPRSTLAGALIAAAALLVGVGLGVLGAAWAGVPEALTLHDPVLEVRTTGGGPIEVTVDGAAARGPVRLSPGAHEVRVALPHAEPWQVRLQLQPGEHRVVVVDAAPPEVVAATPAAAE